MRGFVPIILALMVSVVGTLHADEGYEMLVLEPVRVGVYAPEGSKVRYERMTPAGRLYSIHDLGVDSSTVELIVYFEGYMTPSEQEMQVETLTGVAARDRFGNPDAELSKYDPTTGIVGCFTEFASSETNDEMVFVSSIFTDGYMFIFSVVDSSGRYYVHRSMYMTIARSVTVLP